MTSIVSEFTLQRIFIDYDSFSSIKNIKVVLVHELGHALGLRHEPQVHDSVMRPVYSGWSDDIVLGDDDIAAIRRLYGINVLVLIFMYLGILLIYYK